MSISQTYCDFATGNDYRGTTFNDGSFVNATLTLTRAGAFADSQVDHWLYLDDNGSGEVTPGYYRITTVTSDDAVVLDADIRSGVDDPTDVVCTQADGTTTLPWRSLQGAFDLITRDATNGDQVNIKAGSTQKPVNSGSLARYGSPTEGAPLVIRGYTTIANDGGKGTIDLGGAERFSYATIPYMHAIDLIVYNTGYNLSCITLGTGALVLNCEAHTSSGASSTGIVVRAHSAVIGCYVHDLAGRGISTGYGSSLVVGNYVKNCSATGIVMMNPFDTAIGNIVYGVRNAMAGISCFADRNNIISNVVVGAANSTGDGINTGTGSDDVGAVVMNNIIMGFSGAGGAGITSGGGNLHMLGHNAFYNNTTDEELTGIVLADLDGDVALAADPFTDAANGDFSLTAAGKTALASLGWPSSYLGAHVNTNPHITIGAIQQELASGGGFPKIASLLGRTRM